MKIGDKITIGVEFTVVAFGGAEGQEEVSLTATQPFQNHITRKLSDLTASEESLTPTKDE